MIWRFRHQLHSVFASCLCCRECDPPCDLHSHNNCIRSLPSLPPWLLLDVVKKAILDAFQLSDAKDCRLWHRYMTNSYEQVKGESLGDWVQDTVQWVLYVTLVETIGEGREAVNCFTMYSCLLSSFELCHGFNSSYVPLCIHLPSHPPFHQTMTCFRSQGSTLVSWWYWRWRRMMEHGQGDLVIVSQKFNGELLSLKP